MQNFFEPKANQDKLKQEIDRWIGTPYQHMGFSSGGMDCTKFVGIVLVNLGILQSFDKRVYYPTDWYIHGGEEICLNAIESTMTRYLNKDLDVQKILYSGFEQSIEVGDLVCISKNAKGFVNHTALYLGDDKIAHCVQGKGVCISQFSFSYSKRTKYLFRLFYKD